MGSFFLNPLTETVSPFVLFRYPQTQEVQVFFQENDQRHTTTDFKETGFVFAPFQPEASYLFIPSTHRESLPFSEVKALAFTQREARDRASLSTLFSGNREHSALFQNKVKAAHAHLAATAVEKMVLSSSFSLPLAKEKASNPLSDFIRLAAAYPNAFVYYWHHPATNDWVGATPERLFSLSENNLQTVALAGTLPEGATAADWTEKEKHEQQVVTDSIVAGLSTFCAPHQIQVGERTTIEAGNLKHLQTEIRAEIPLLKIKQALSVLHPTPAVGGLPKQEAIAYIEAHEVYNRRFYTGFLGPFSGEQQADLFVNLRCAQRHATYWQLYAGAGITLGSDPQKEWVEICRKATTLAQIL